MLINTPPRGTFRISDNWFEKIKIDKSMITRTIKIGFIEILIREWSFFESFFLNSGINFESDCVIPKTEMQESKTIKFVSVETIPSSSLTSVLPRENQKMKDIIAAMNQSRER